MAFFDFLKKIFEEEKKEEQGSVKIEELESCLEKELKNIIEMEDKVKIEINAELKNLIGELRKGADELNNIRLDNRKESEKMKFIVRENLNLYVSHLEDLIKSLENIKYSSLKEYIQEINKRINNFDKSSKNSFEKATILTGEPGKTRDVIRNYLGKMNNTLIDKKDILMKREQISKVRDKLNEKERLKINESEISREIAVLNEKINNSEKEKEKIINNIEKLKKSEEYQKEIENEKKIKEEKEKFAREIADLKNKINLKSLAKQFHSDEKKNELIKRYQENFLEALEKDIGFEIFKIINPEFSEQLKQIKEKKEELNKELVFETGRKIEENKKEIEIMNSVIIGVKKQIEQETKRKEKIIGGHEEIIKEIKEYSKILSIPIE